MRTLAGWVAVVAGWVMVSACQPLKHQDPLDGPGVMTAITPTSPMYNDAPAAEEFHLRRVRGSVGVDVASDF